MKVATVLRAQLSERNKYYVDKHRYYELKHFCLQYPTWKQRYSDLDGYSRIAAVPTDGPGGNEIADPTHRAAAERDLYFEKMQLVEQAAFEADGDLAPYIIRAVTEELSYSYLKAKMDIPCGRDMYYDRYRRFFWLLDKARG